MISKKEINSHHDVVIKVVGCIQSQPRSYTDWKAVCADLIDVATLLNRLVGEIEDKERVAESIPSVPPT